MQIEISPKKISGPHGSLAVAADDEVTRKLLMLMEGQCGLGPEKAAAKFGYSRQRYFQLRQLYDEKGAEGLHSQKRGPRSNYRRGDEVVCQTIRHRFLDPQASTAVIAQKLRQAGFKISKRSVDRIMEQFGLQKKTLLVPPAARRGKKR